MRIVNLGDTNSILNKFVAELRDVDIQKDSLRFRRNVERIGEIMAYEISKEFHYSTKDIQSPLGIAPMNTPDDRIVISTILRAGLPSTKVSFGIWIMRRTLSYPLTANIKTV